MSKAAKETLMYFFYAMDLKLPPPDGKTMEGCPLMYTDEKGRTWSFTSGEWVCVSATIDATWETVQRGKEALYMAEEADPYVHSNAMEIATRLVDALKGGAQTVNSLYDALQRVDDASCFDILMMENARQVYYGYKEGNWWRAPVTLQSLGPYKKIAGTYFTLYFRGKPPVQFELLAESFIEYYYR